VNVHYIDHMGTDLTVSNSARVSLGKHKLVFDEADERLLNHLASHRPIHFTPFAHPHLIVRVEAPIFVARQLFRHQVGLAVNEISRRYVDAEPAFFHPTEWRRRPDGSIKQGSGEKLDEVTSDCVSNLYLEAMDYLQSCYRNLIELGVAPEQARMLLPQSAYTEWYWTGSLYAFFRVVAHRIKADAQSETRLIAERLHDILFECFPKAYGALVRHGLDSIDDETT